MPPISDNWPDVQASLDVLEPEYAERVTSMLDFLQPHFTHIHSKLRHFSTPSVTRVPPHHRPLHLGPVLHGV